MEKREKIRLDQFVLQQGLADSRERAKALIMAGKILVDRQPALKPGMSVSTDAKLSCKGEDHPFVSRGGVKLQAALQSFAIDVADTVCLDVGASTGGFSDCLLYHGARRVYAVDVGYGQLAWKLRQNPRVVVMERTNARHLKPGDIPEPIDVATVDVSFISLDLILPAILPLLASAGLVIPLIKPQFEVGRGQVGKGGVVRDRRLQAEVIKRLQHQFESFGFEWLGCIPSPLLGPKGKQEYLVYLRLRVST
jgi:23S rRNA (cytidine1920-2'-O)/16S rRNA (cytidine1409-2'-O)-methyltransferase